MNSPIRSGPATHLFTVTLQPGTSARDRQRYFRRMQRDLIRRGLIVNYCVPNVGPALCIAVKDYDARWRTDRHIYVNWVVDQPQSRDLHLLSPLPLQQLLEDNRAALMEVIQAGLLDGQVGNWPLGRVISGLITRAIYHLRATN